MKIQYIGYLINLRGIKVNTIKNPESFNNYDINLIDLNSDRIWVSKTSSITIESKADFRTLSDQLIYSKKPVVIILPSNLNWRYDASKHEQNKYYRQIKVKDVISLLVDYLNEIIKIESKLIFGLNITTIGGVTISSDFIFDINEDQHDVFCSDSGDIIAYQSKFYEQKVILTTLNPGNDEQIHKMLDYFNLTLKVYEEEPIWFKEIKMFDDRKQLENREHSLKEIEQENRKIDEYNKILDENNRLKSILYSNGDFLVEVVGEILNYIIGYNPSEFKDLKREDFLIDIDGFKFVGEIKGISNNVKNANISQLEYHYQSFIDENPNVEAKGILIVNNQRNKPLEERDPIDQNPIKLAIRNGSLIIQTITLLQMLEKYKCGLLTKEKIVEILKSRTGLLSIEDIN